MEFAYIDTICDAYFNDRELYKYNVFESTSEGIKALQMEIKSIVQSLRLEDIDMYCELQDCDKGDQQKIMYMLLDSYIIETYPEIEEGWVGSIISVPIAIASGLLSIPLIPQISIYLVGITASIIFFKGITKIKTRITNALHDITKLLSGIILKATVGGKVRYAILVKNLDKCASKCGLGPRPERELNRFTSLAIKSNLPYPEKAREQASCLIECYLDFTLEQVKVVASSYINCLSATGELPKDLSSLSMLEVKPMGEHCVVFYESLKGIEEQFQTAVNYIYEHKPRDRQDWNNKFNKAIIESMKVQSKHIPRQFDKKQKFDKNKKFDNKQRY